MSTVADDVRKGADRYALRRSKTIATWKWELDIALTNFIDRCWMEMFIPNRLPQANYELQYVMKLHPRAQEKVLSL